MKSRAGSPKEPRLVASGTLRIDGRGYERKRGLVKSAPSPKRAGLLIEEEGRQIWVEPAFPAEAVIEVRVGGVRVIAWRGRTRVPVRGFIDDSALRLDSSKAAIVLDRAWDDAWSAAEDASERLVLLLTSRRHGLDSDPAVARWLDFLSVASFDRSPRVVRALKRRADRR